MYTLGGGVFFLGRHRNILISMAFFGRCRWLFLFIMHRFYTLMKRMHCGVVWFFLLLLFLFLDRKSVV